MVRGRREMLDIIECEKTFELCTYKTGAVVSDYRLRDTKLSKEWLQLFHDSLGSSLGSSLKCGESFNPCTWSGRRLGRESFSLGKDQRSPGEDVPTVGLANSKDEVERQLE